MSWEEAMKEQAGLALQDRYSAEANTIRSTTSTAWDPHEIWLTRVKQPREQAAGRVGSSAESQVSRLPD